MEDKVLSITERQLNKYKTAVHDLEILRRMYDRVVAERDALKEAASLAERMERLKTLIAAATDEQEGTWRLNLPPSEPLTAN